MRPNGWEWGVLLYCLPNIVRLTRSKVKYVSRSLIWAGGVARKEEGTSAFKILPHKSTGKRSLG